MIIAILVGAAAGFIGSIPVAGPVAGMIIERAMSGRHAAALAMAMGTAVAEGVYAFLAVFGMSHLLDYPWVVPASKGFAGAVLVAVGLSFALRKPSHETNALEERVRSVKPKSVAGQWALGFGITMANPTLLATWSAVTSTLVASEAVTLNAWTALAFGLAVAVGASSWFLIVVALIKRYSTKLSKRTIERVVQYIGWGLVGLGVWFLIDLVRYLIAD